MSTLVKKQHYVWAHHLGAWETDGVVWCHLAEQKKLFPTNRLSVANETFFYRAKRLTPGDLRALELLISQSSREELRQLNRGWIEGNQQCFARRAFVENLKLPPDLKAEALVALDADEKTWIERYHTAVELSFQGALEQLRAGRSDFYADQSERIHFIKYLCFQYFRTAAMRKKLVANMPRIGGYDPERTWLIEALIYSTNVGTSLVGSHANYKIGFLETAGPSPFITADQPVINLLPPTGDELVFYFPISPSRAIIYGPIAAVGPDRRAVSQLEVERLNHEIFSRSSNQTYSNDRAYLEALVSLDKIESNPA